MIQVEEAVVEVGCRLAENTHQLFLRCPAIASQCRPGQFVRLQSLASGSIFWRPFSIYNRPDENRLELVIARRGANTEQYCRLAPGQTIMLSGPHGRPVIVNPTFKRILLVGGGCGLASLHFLALVLKEKASVIAGFKTRQNIFGQDDFSRWVGERFIVATDDGSFGTPGTVVDVFGQMLELQIAKSYDFSGDCVYTCGPLPMMKGIADLCQPAKIKCVVFLEGMMVCGLGACKADAIFMNDGTVKHVCTDGPAFDAREVNWNGLC